MQRQADMSDGDAAQPTSSSKTSRALLQQDLDTQKDASGDGGADGDDKDGGSSRVVPPAECPICRFIEAGPCGGEHRTWFTCRADAKETGEDFVQRCAPDFRAFFSCMLAHQQYYEPFLEAFHVDTERSQEALDAAAATDNMHQRQSDGTGGSAEKQK